MKAIMTVFTLFSAILLSACEPEVGSKRWCEKLDETPKGEWSANDVQAYAGNCIFRKPEEN